MIEFRNEPLTDFTKKENQKSFQEALNRVQSNLGKEYNLIIGGEEVQTNNKIRTYNQG